MSLIEDDSSFKHRSPSIRRNASLHVNYRMKRSSRTVIFGGTWHPIYKRFVYTWKLKKVLTLTVGGTQKNNQQQDPRRLHFPRKCFRSCHSTLNPHCLSSKHYTTSQKDEYNHNEISRETRAKISKGSFSLRACERPVSCSPFSSIFARWNGACRHFPR